MLGRRAVVTLLTAVFAVAAAAWWFYGRRPAPKALPQEWALQIRALEPAFEPAAHTAKEGDALAQSHCQICHLRPDPAVLPQASWLEVFDHHVRITAEGGPPGVLRLGLPPKDFREYRIPAGDLARIMYFYYTAAPGRLPPAPTVEAAAPAPFTVVHEEAYDPAQPVMYTLAAVLPRENVIVMGEVISRRLIVRGPNGAVVSRVALTGSATAITEHPSGLLVTQIGPQPYSTDDAEGLVLNVPWEMLRRGAGAAPEVFLSGLRRPVHTTLADLDGDGSGEFLIEEFGFSRGALNFYKKRNDGGYEAHVLIDRAGALSAYVLDMTGDGVPDILAGISQSTEAVYLLTGLGGGAFESKIVLQRHPAFGLNQLLVEDLNGDGYKDLVLANGDMLTLPSKPVADYAGIHVFLNDGRNGFGTEQFYPLVGAVQAVARDFDRDGDLDLAAVSATPDFSKAPLETAIYLENRGDGSFLTRRIPGAERGCWSVVAAGDLNGDKKDELVLGGAYLPMFDDEYAKAFQTAAPASLLILSQP